MGTDAAEEADPARPQAVVGGAVLALLTWLAEAAGGLLIGLTIVIAVLTFEPLWVVTGLVLLVLAAVTMVMLFTRWRTRRHRWVAFGAFGLVAAGVLATMAWTDAL